MSRCQPGSQTREMMQQKAEIARRLLEKGLTVAQVSEQIRCSRAFVRRVRDEMPVSVRLDVNGA